jgi:peptidoglycan hydrolase CwlO-like protein
MTAALSTVSNFKDNNIHVIQQQRELQDNLDREQDSFYMLAHHLSDKITETNDILRSTQCAIADLRKQIAILDNKVDKLSSEIWRRNEQ